MIERLHYIAAHEIPDAVRQKMLDAVRDVYNDDTAHEFADEMDNGFPYEYVVLVDTAADIVVGLGAMMKSGLDFDIWELAWGLVRAEYRGRGMGRRLNDERIDIIRWYGGKKILCVTKKIWHLSRNGFHIACTFANGDNLMVCEL